MDPRDQALKILQQARDVLAERLAQRILECRQEILDDAEGQSYLSEIETIYDQLGGRLAHINSMLAHLPAVEDPRTAEAPLGEPIIAEMTSGYAENFPSMEPLAAALALPPPESGLFEPIAAPARITFQSFAEHIQSNDLAAAGRALAELLGCEAECAKGYTEEFCQRLTSQPELLWRILRQRAEPGSGAADATRVLLVDCFGLEGHELDHAVTWLTVRSVNSD